MPAGRPKKPTQLHLLNGNPSKLSGLEARAEQEPQPALFTRENVPPPPKHLPTVAKKCWKDNAPRLAEHHLLSDLDLNTLEMYCINYAFALQSLAAIKKAKQLVSERSTAHGDTYEEISAHTRAFQQHQKAMLELAREFGMTPAARGRMALPQGESAADEMEKLLTGRG